MFDKQLVLKSAAALSLALVADVASAHIGYGTDLALANGATTAMTVNSNAGQLAGLQAGFTGDTHNTRARWFSLTQDSLVNFTIRGLANTAVSGNANAYLNGLTASVLNPGFSLFKEANGVTPFSSQHDGAGDAASPGGVVNPTAADALPANLKSWLASNDGYASWSPFAKINNLITYQGGTVAGNDWGVYDANGNWNISNNAGGVNNWNFITSGSDASATEVSFSGVLSAGVYAIFIGGEDATDYANLYNLVQNTNGGSIAGATVADFLKGTGTATEQQLYAGLRLSRQANITFSAAPVPVPGAVWLFGSAMAGLIGFGRRKAAMAA